MVQLIGYNITNDMGGHMQYYRTGTKIGVFVFITLCLLLFLVLSIGQFQLFKDTKDVYVYFDFINGLVKNAPVRYAGVEIGRVRDIQILSSDETLIDKVDKPVEVMLRVLNTIDIPTHAHVSINTLGLLGEKYVEISSQVRTTEEKGSRVFLEDGGRIIGEDLVTMGELLESGKVIVSSLQRTMLSIEELTGTLNNAFQRDKLVSIVDNVDAMTISLQHTFKQADHLLFSHTDDISEIIQNLKHTTHSAKQFTQKIEKNPSSLLWKSREARRKELEEKKKSIQQHKNKSVDSRGRIVPSHILR